MLGKVAARDQQELDLPSWANLLLAADDASVCGSLNADSRSAAALAGR
jgi:hypothetical protein